MEYLDLEHCTLLPNVEYQEHHINFGHGYQGEDLRDQTRP